MNINTSQTISKLFHYKLILDYEGTTYPMEILYALENSVVLKTFDSFKKEWTDRITGLLVHTKDALMHPVSGKILGLRPLSKNGEDLDFEAKEWLLEVEVDKYEEIPNEWIAFSLAEDN